MWYGSISYRKGRFWRWLDELTCQHPKFATKFLVFIRCGLAGWTIGYCLYRYLNFRVLGVNRLQSQSPHGFAKLYNMPVHAGHPRDNKGPKILCVLWSLTGLTAIIVAARMYIRLLLLRNVGSDDYLIVISLFLGLVYCGITTANVAIGYGKHAYVLEQGTIELASLLNSLSFLFGILSFALPKLAVTAMLNRILNPSLIQQVWLWTLTGTAAIVSCVCIMMLFTMCDPPEGLWKMHLVMEGKATCKDTWILINYAIFTGAISAFVDLYLAIYPTTVLMRLHMSLRKRLALCAALSLGSIASAMAIIKCTQLKGLANKDDYTYGTADLVMWTNVESNIVIIASCIPTLQPVLELVLGRRTASSYNNSRNRYKDSSNMKDSSYTNKSIRPARKSDLKLTKIESQESILRGNQNEDAHPLGTIRRIDNVIVEYEVRGKGHEDVEGKGLGGW